MDCAEETSALREALSPVAGIREISFDILNGRMNVGYDPLVVDINSIERAAATTGLKVEPWRDVDADSEHADGSRARRTALTAISGALLVVGYGTHLIQRG